MRVKIVAAVCVVVLLTGCTAKPVDDPAAAAASEAAKAREAVPTTTPSNQPGTPVAAVPEPAGLAKNPIYRVGKLSPPGCKEPVVTLTSLAAARSYYTQLVACLNKTWAPAVRTAGFTFKAPRLVVILGQSPDSTCDAPDGELYYCRGTIYMDARADLEYEKENRAANRALMLFFIAHEYGHHIQALTGIAKAQSEHAINLNGVDLQLQENRRVELQADCFSGAFAASLRETFPIDDAWVRTWSATYAHYKDPGSDHGQGGTRKAWSLKGFTDADLTACNTFMAPPTALR